MILSFGSLCCLFRIALCLFLGLFVWRIFIIISGIYLYCILSCCVTLSFGIMQDVTEYKMQGTFDSIPNSLRKSPRSPHELR